MELPVGPGGLQHQLVQLSDLLVPEVPQLLLREGGAEARRGAAPPLRRGQDLRLQGVLVALRSERTREVMGCLVHGPRPEVLPLVVGGVNAITQLI